MTLTQRVEEVEDTAAATAVAESAAAAAEPAASEEAESGPESAAETEPENPDTNEGGPESGHAGIDAGEPDAETAIVDETRQRYLKARPQTTIEVRGGFLCLDPGVEPAQLTREDDGDLHLIVDGDAVAGRVQLTGLEAVEIRIPAARGASWRVGTDRDDMEGWLEIKPGETYQLMDAVESEAVLLQLERSPVMPDDLDDETAAVALQEEGIVWGIEKERLQKLVAQMPPGRHVIANGRPAKNGRPGMLESLVAANMGPPFTIRPDGTVDYWDRPEIPNVDAGVFLARIIPPTEGEDGANVRAQTLRAQPGPPVIVRTGPGAALAAGDEAAAAAGDETVHESAGTAANEAGAEEVQKDRRSLVVAVRTGRPGIIERKELLYEIDVVPLYVHDGHVDMVSGNIHFKGDVTVKGDVQEGFRIVAAGNVDISGSVFGGQIIAAGEILVAGGVINSQLETRGDEGGITALRVQHSHLESAGTVAITKGGSYFSTIKSAGDVVMRGAMIGGLIQTAGRMVHLAEAGSRMGTETIIEVGAGAEVQLAVGHPGVRIYLCHEILVFDNERRNVNLRAEEWQ
ncbi:MAG: FapA family protein [Thermaerobacterales bacterium]